MSRPALHDVHVDVPLTTLSLAFMQAAEGFVASRAFPEIPVDKVSDKYFTYDRSYWNRAEMRPRAPGTESAGAEYGLSTDSYACTVYAIHKDIPDQIRANADGALALDREAAEFCGLQARLKQELTWASDFFKIGVWGSEAAGVATAQGAGQVLHWGVEDGDPIGNIRSAARAIQQKTGMRPNKLVLGRPVYDVLVDRADLVERIKYTAAPASPAVVTRQALAALFDLDEVLVMEAVHNAAAEGLAAAHDFIGGKNALLLYTPATPGLMTASAGYTFSWANYLEAGPGGFGVRRFRMEHLRTERIEAEVAYDQKLVARDLGHFWSGIVA